MISAAVNLAAETAIIRLVAGEATAADVRRAVEQAGYAARLPDDDKDSSGEVGQERQDVLALVKVVVSLATAIDLIVAMVFVNSGAMDPNLAILPMGIFAAVVAIVGLAARGLSLRANGSADQVVVTANQFRFMPKTLDVPEGTTIHLAFHIDGWERHDFEVEGVPNIHVDARPGQTPYLTFTAPAPGRYTYIFTLPGHANAGMLGTLVVEPRGIGTTWS